HFIIRSYSLVIFGTPNGQARTQLLQPRQRAFKALRTTPSSPFLMASAGQTSAQVGDSQCMHTVGIVCVEYVRSMYSRWIIGNPLCVSHSLHACTQALQPMQRVGSMKKPYWSGTGIRSFLFLASPQRQQGTVPCWRCGLAGKRLYCCGSYAPAYSGVTCALNTRTAQTLNSGIFEIGSCAAM